MNNAFKKAKEYENKKMWNEALEGYKLIYKNGRKDALVLDKIGWCQSRLGFYKESIHTYEKVIDMEPKKAKWHYMLGYQYYCMKYWVNAISCFKEAIKYHPEYLIAYYRLSYAIKQSIKNNFDSNFTKQREAIKYLNICESIYDRYNGEQKKKNRNTYIKILFLKGKILITLKETGEAIKVLEKAYEVERGNNYITYNLCKAYYYDGQLNKVIELLPELPDKYYVEELEAKTMIRLGNYNKAIDTYDKILVKRKKDYLYRDISGIYLQLGDLDKAYYYSKKALDKGKENHKNLFLMGLIYYRLGLFNAAKNMMLGAINLKKQSFNANYSEAQKLLTEINQVMEGTNYKEDCKDTLKRLNKVDDSGRSSIKQGRINRWFNSKGYEFIKSDCESYFFHISDVKNNFKENVEEDKFVEFYLVETKKGLKAMITKILR